MTSGQTRSTDEPGLHIAHHSPCCYGMAKAWWVTGWTMSRRLRLISRSDADPRYSAARRSVCSWIRFTRARGGLTWSSRRPRLRIGRCWSVPNLRSCPAITFHLSCVVSRYDRAYGSSRNSIRSYRQRSHSTKKSSEATVADRGNHIDRKA
jgi:hypothetical protein